MNPELALAGAAGLVALWAALEGFRITEHGDNPWSLDGFVGAALIKGSVETAASLTGASWASVYRAERVQRAIYDDKRKNAAQWAVVEASAKKAGMSTEGYVEFLAKSGRHLRGLAADFSAPGKTTAALARELFVLAEAGRIGRVKKVLDERDHVHVEWFAPWEPAKAPVLEAV